MSLLKELLAESSGAPGAFTKDTPPGTTVAGKIVSVNVRQATDIKTGEKQTWDDGNPKQQVVVIISTDQRDPENPDDNGDRAIYIKWWGHGRQALIEALKAAKADDLEVGGMFADQYVGEGVATQRGLSAPKIHKYEYRKPTIGSQLLGGVPGVPPGQTATVTTEQGTHTVPSPGSSQPSVPAVTSTPAAAVDPAQVAAVRGMIAANVPDAAITAAFPAISPELLAALRNAG